MTKTYYSGTKKRNKTVKLWNVIAILVCLVILSLAVVYNLNKTVPEAQAEMMWFSGGELEFNLTTDKGYVKHELWQAGLLDEWEFVEKIINCESGWRADAVGVNTNGSYDLGILQINSIHKNISNADKFDVKKAVEWSINKRLNDGNWSAWCCSRKVK